MGFAHIHARDVPGGILPKRQAVGTGVVPPAAASSTPTDTTVETPQDSSADDTPALTSATPADNNGDVAAPESTTSASEGEAAASSPTSVPTSVDVTTTDAQGSTITSAISTSSIAASSTNDSSSLIDLGSTTIDRNSITRKTTVTSALVGKSTSTTLSTSYWSSDNRVYSTVVEQQQVFSSTTGYATATIDPSLAASGGDGSNLSDGTKRVIGGVVGGIGGAILIGGLVFVFWRLYGKKKHVDELGEGDRWAHSRTDSVDTAKMSSSNATDEIYYSPNGPINKSSNF